MGNVSRLSDYRRPERAANRPEATGKGFALLHRKIQETEFYRKDSQAVHLWLHLILSVNHAPTTVTTDYGDVVVERGQLITGKTALEKETGIDVERVKYLLRKFKKLGMITTYSPGKFTVITIVKYAEYQGDFDKKSFPQLSPNFPPAKPEPVRDGGEVVPQDSPNFPPNNNITNNSIPNGIESVSSTSKAERKAPTHSCQDVVDVYHRLLPECPSVRALSEKRRNLIRTFWVKAGKITRQLDEKPFSMQAWEDYLRYISQNCRWMLGTRPDSKTGKTWRCKNIEFFLQDEVYLKVREGVSDDV